MIDTQYAIMIALAAVEVILLIMGIVLLCKQSNMKKRLNKFMEGDNAKSLDDIIKSHISNFETIKEQTDKNSELIEELFKKMQYTVCKVGMVKYDAFNEMGGKLSFALVMLNENNTGFSMNSMHGTEGSYVYVKEIINGESYIPLGDEEQKALAEALEAK